MSSPFDSGVAETSKLMYYCQVENEKGLSSSNIAELRVYVYHQAFAHILASIEHICKHGKLVRCSDGVVRRMFPTLAAIAADYEEL